MPVLFSYRNQSIDLLWKSIDWFLYEGNTGIWWVKRRGAGPWNTPGRLFDPAVIFIWSLKHLRAMNNAVNISLDDNTTIES